jgi:hypothetical protein
MCNSKWDNRNKGNARTWICDQGLIFLDIRNTNLFTYDIKELKQFSI